MDNISINLIRIRIRLILFWINKYEYNLFYNDIMPISQKLGCDRQKLKPDLESDHQS